jgi:Ras family protein A
VCIRSALCGDRTQHLSSGVLILSTAGQDFVPGVFGGYVADLDVDGKNVALALWDTAAQEDYERLRPLNYPDSHVILICFAIDSPDSFDNVQEKVRMAYSARWASQLTSSCSGS